MDWIFEYEESDGSRLSVAPMEGELWFKTVSATGSSTVSVVVVPQAVNELHAALGVWMAKNGITARSAIPPEPVYGPDSLIGQLITQAVTAEVAKVLPLHLAPVAYVHGRNCPGQLFCQDANGVQVIDCQNEPDPEPHDVGHPVYEDARPHPVDTDPAPGFLGATLPVGTSHCPNCKHGWNDHTAGFCWGGDCACPAERPAPVPITESDKVWGEQGTPPAPVALECTCDKHNHRPVVREGSPATCFFRSCGCRYRGTS